MGVGGQEVSWARRVGNGVIFTWSSCERCRGEGNKGGGGRADLLIGPQVKKIQSYHLRPSVSSVFIIN